MDIVLFLTYFFPPLGGGGVQRSAKFFKYLPALNWSPIAVAALPNRRNTIEQSLDPTQLRDVTDDDAVYRCKSLEASYLYSLLHTIRLRRILFETERLIPLMHMDYKIGWYLPALRQAKEILKRTPVKMIYSSSPPYSAHLAALQLKRSCGLPWVADFRDPLTQVGDYDPPTPIHAYLDRKIEHKILLEADRVIANTQQNRDNLISKYAISPSKVIVIPNGFDPADFDRVDETDDVSSRFIISCIGKFYEMADSGVFFRAYRRFSDQHNNTILRLVGWHSRAVHRSALSILKIGSWEHVERVGHLRAIREMRNSSALLANLPGESCDHWVPGKLYEYFAAGRPILLVGPVKGMAADLIRGTRTGKVAGFDEEEILQALETLYSHWNCGPSAWNPDLTAIAQFDRRAQTKRLAHLFSEICSEQAADESDSRLTIDLHQAR